MNNNKNIRVIFSIVSIIMFFFTFFKVYTMAGFDAAMDPIYELSELYTGFDLMQRNYLYILILAIPIFSLLIDFKVLVFDDEKKKKIQLIAFSFMFVLLLFMIIF